MKIQNIKISNFRNYDNMNLSFSPKLNIIYGQNGSGKTNLVEAIYLLALTKSFRVNNDSYLIKKGSENASVEGKLLTNIVTNYKISLNNNGKKVEIDNNKLDRISDYISRINIVLFNPDDLNIIGGPPSIRRRLLNIEISQIEKEYLFLLNDYEKVLKNRNSYLKELYLNGNGSKEYLDILTNKLIEIGLKINKYRGDYLKEINEYISKIYQNIFETGNLIIKYVSNFNNKSQEQLFKDYTKNYSKEMAFGKTLTGIHHDDIEFLLDGNKLREWGSVGQQKNSIISFKLSEVIIIEKRTKEYPILILDDLFSELDEQKIKNIFKMLNDYVQTFITTTEIKKIHLKNYSDYKLFKVKNGLIEEEEYGK